MHIKNIKILEVIEYKKEIVICEIRVEPKSTTYYHGQKEPVQSYHWLQPEHWALFDAKLEQVIASRINSKNENQEEEEQKFELNTYIQVRVKGSCIHRDTLKSCCEPDLKHLNKKSIALALECSIECNENRLHNGLYRKEMSDNLPVKESDNAYNEENTMEYNPAMVSSQGTAISVDGITQTVSLSPPVYKPTPKTDSTNTTLNSTASPIGSSVTILETEEPYSPKPVLYDDVLDIIDASPIPTYSPAKILKRRSKSMDYSKSKYFDNDSGTVDTEANSDTEKFEAPSTHNMRLKKKRKIALSVEKEIISLHSNKKQKKDVVPESESAEDDIIVSTDNENNDVSSSNKSKRKLSNRNVTQVGPLRRSSRSPVKPKWPRIFGQEATEQRTPKQKKKNHNNRHKQLFGSDDEESNDSDFAVKMPKNKNLNTSQNSSSKKNHKRRNECLHEKQTINTWLSKKKIEPITIATSNSSIKRKQSKISPTSSTVTTTKRRIALCSSRSDDEPSTLPIIYPSKEEMAKQMNEEKGQLEQNLELKKILEEWVGPPPDKVDFLTLNDMSSGEILNSFKKYKHILDNIFKTSLKKTNIHSHEGVNHYMVMPLIDDKIQMEMLNKLGTEYQKDQADTSNHIQLFSNAMLPEWIVCIFMKKFKFTRDDAIKQLNAQEAYKLHLQAQSSNSFPWS